MILAMINIIRESVSLRQALLASDNTYSNETFKFLNFHVRCFQSSGKYLNLIYHWINFLFPQYPNILHRQIFLSQFQ